MHIRSLHLSPASQGTEADVHLLFPGGDGKAEKEFNRNELKAQNNNKHTCTKQNEKELQISLHPHNGNNLMSDPTNF